MGQTESIPSQGGESRTASARRRRKSQRSEAAVVSKFVRGGSVKKAGSTQEFASENLASNNKNGKPTAPVGAGKMEIVLEKPQRSPPVRPEGRTVKKLKSPFVEGAGNDNIVAQLQAAAMPSFAKTTQAPGAACRTSGTASVPPAASGGEEEGSRDRLISCPDCEHHLESELLDRLERYFSTRYHYQVEGEKRDDTSSLSHANSAASLDPRMKVFEGKHLPKITVKEYLKRLVYYLTGIAEFERKSKNDTGIHSDLAIRYLLATIIYLERIEAKTSLRVNGRNVHRLLITGCVVAAKILDDIQPNTQYFADLGGVSVPELSQLEWVFVEMLDYKVQIMPQDFLAKYWTLLDRRATSFEGGDELM